MEMRKKIGLVFLINFILPLHVLLYFGFFNLYLDYAMNLSFLSFLVLGSKDLETDKREFKGLKVLKIIPVILYVYFIIIQVGYTFINMILGYSFDFFFLWFYKCYRSRLIFINASYFLRGYFSFNFWFHVVWI